MSNDEKYVAGCVFVLAMIILLFGIIIENKTNIIQNLRTEAVQRGYAEWYSKDEGSPPTLWRWK